MAAVPSKCLLKSAALVEYINDLAFPREHEQLKELREATDKRFPTLSIMNVPVDEGQFISMLVKLMNAKRTIEIGVFTGYSLLSTALALPDDAKMTAIDINSKGFNFGLPFIQKAGVEHKINFIEADAHSILKEMVESKPATEEFDFAFVDADKGSYVHYHEPLLKLVKVGGVIAYDNTLWLGHVAEEEGEVPEYMREDRKAILKFNAGLAADKRIEVILLSVGDGITLCRRLA